MKLPFSSRAIQVEILDDTLVAIVSSAASLSWAMAGAAVIDASNMVMINVRMIPSIVEPGGSAPVNSYALPKVNSIG